MRESALSNIYGADRHFILKLYVATLRWPFGTAVCVPPLMVEIDHAFDKITSSKPIEASSHQKLHGRRPWLLVGCGFGPNSAAHEEPPAASNDRVGDVLM